MNFKNLSTANIKILNFLVLFYPVALMSGNFLTNLNVVLVCIFGVMSYKNKILNLEQIKSNILIFLFFVILILITIFNLESNKEENNILKSFLYLRYFVFFLVVKYMIENNDINLKKFLILSLFLITFISLDVLLQAVTEKNIFGMVSNVVSRHNSGIFGKEVVAGSYIQRFCIFALICLPLVSKKNHNIKSFITFSLILIFFLGILFSGNRMPLFMFFFSMFLILILIKELRLAFSMGILFSLLIFIYTLSVNEKVLKNYGNFYFHSKKIITDVIKFSGKKHPELENKKYEDFTREYNAGTDSEKLRKKYEMIPFRSGHTVVFLTAIDTWSDNMFLGSGIKSFRMKCKTKLHLPNRVCTSHPHNYYLELLNDTGILGSLILLFAIFILIKNKIYNLRNFTFKEKVFLCSVVVLLLTEFFPIRSSGGFFNTNNSSFIFLLLGFLSGLKNLKKEY